MLPEAKPIGVPLEASLKADYRAVVLRLAYAQLENRTFALVFGIGEFIPMECPILEAWPTDPTDPKLGVFKKGQRRVYYRRFVLTVDEFLGWWEQAGTNNLCIPQAPKKIPLATSSLQHEPHDSSWNLSSQWPYFANTPNCLSEVLQYRTRSWAPPGQTEILAELKILLEDENIQSGLRVLMGDSYDDLRCPWLGSLHAMAPNPVYRSLRTSLHNHGADEWIRVQVVPRSGSDMSTLQLLVSEVRPTGVGSIHLEKIQNHDFLLKRSGGVDQISIAVFCTKRGNLEVHGPMSFLQRTKLRFGHVSKELHIQTSAAPTCEEKPFVQRFVEYTEAQIGGEPPASRALLTRLHAYRRTKDNKNLANRISELTRRF